MGITFQLGQSYTKEYIKDALGCEGEGYLPHRAGKVVCCNVMLKYNPDAPDIILPGTGNGIDYWAEVFCKQDDAIPVFIKEQNAYLWQYVGDYEVDRWTADANEIAKQKQQSKRTDKISRVIYLKRAECTLSAKPAPEQKTFKPSQRQQAVYDFQKKQNGNLFIDAVAGSGKTTTLVWLADKWLDDNPFTDGRALFVAFNKSIANELESRLPPAIKAKTIHSVGLDALRRTEKKTEPNLDDSKYLSLALEFLRSHGIKHDQSLAKAIERLVHFVMVTLNDPKDEAKLTELLLHYGIEVEEESLPLVAQAVPHLIKRGIDLKDSIISYDDMIYLPCVLNLPVPQYQMLYCDEAQDLSAAQLKLIRMLRASDGRIFFVGDPHQAIYGFAGADCKSVETIIETTKAKKLPLDVSYRCPQTHIKLAQQIVPHIKAKTGAEEGTIELIKEDTFFSDPAVRVKQGDLVLCRTSLPLIDAVLHLRSTARSAQVRGNNTAEE